jgi:N-acetyl-gamma-glutamyl-phosphate reductase
MSGPLKTAVLGATGYAGMELTKLLFAHPNVQEPILLRRDGNNRADATLADPFPAGPNGDNYAFQPLDWPALKRQGVELLFLATPHEVSRALVPEAAAEGLRVIDLSGAWRLKEARNRAVYGFADENALTASQLTDLAIYGLPELNGDRIPDAALIANPGCYATSIILALAPLLKADLVDRQHGVICDSKSGVSGAGKEPTDRTHFVSVADNLSAYSVFTHRHCGEIIEQLGVCGSELVFTPHLLPIPRGILSTIYVRLSCATQPTEIEACFRHFYTGKRWVRVFATPRLPQIRFALFTNYCDLGFCLADDQQRLVIVSCVDNLLKGAAGQAIQNMNLMYGWKEEEGLR